MIIIIANNFDRFGSAKRGAAVFLAKFFLLVLFYLAAGGPNFYGLASWAQGTDKSREFETKVLLRSPRFKDSFQGWAAKRSISFASLETMPKRQGRYAAQVLEYWVADINGDSLPDITLYLQLTPFKRNRLPRGMLMAFLAHSDENKDRWLATKVFWTVEIKENSIRVLEPRKLLRGGLLTAELQYRAPRCFECVEHRAEIRLSFDKAQKEWLAK